MRINLSTLSLAPAVLAAAAFTAQPAVADNVYQVHVPFNFVASGKTLPAGDYIIRQDARHDVVKLEGARNAMVWIAGPGMPNPNDNRAILTFDRIGQDHMLRTVQVGSSITSRLDSKYANSLAIEEQIQSGQ